MDIPETYLSHLQKISKEFEKKEEEVVDDTRIGRRIQRIRRDYGNLIERSRFGSLSKKEGKRMNPELTSGKKCETARTKIIEIEQIATLPA